MTDRLIVRGGYTIIQIHALLYTTILVPDNAI
jgi:hypothetical protein